MVDDPVYDKVVVPDILPLPGAHITVGEIAINFLVIVLIDQLLEDAVQDRYVSDYDWLLHSAGLACLHACTLNMLVWFVHDAVERRFYQIKPKG